MRIRSIRPEFWSSDDIAALDWPTRLIFIGLWSYVDDNGVGRDVPKLIKADLFALEDDPHEALKQVTGALKTLETRKLITRYTVASKPYLHISTWDTHQKINRPSASRYPLPTCGNADIPDNLSEPSVSPPADSPVGEGEKGRRGEGEKLVARKRATAMPPDFAPNDGHHQIAAESGVDIRAEYVQFRDHHQAKGSTFKDWDAAFRTWLRNAAKFRKPTKPTGIDLEAAMRRATERDLADERNA